jgi:methionine-rich copper-binding protein CopC
VKLADAAGHAAVLAAPARPDTGETAPVSVALSKPLAAGSYVVTWSTAAKDGHPANGTIAFVVKSAR